MLRHRTATPDTCIYTKETAALLECVPREAVVVRCWDNVRKSSCRFCSAFSLLSLGAQMGAAVTVKTITNLAVHHQNHAMKTILGLDCRAYAHMFRVFASLVFFVIVCLNVVIDVEAIIDQRFMHLLAELNGQGCGALLAELLRYKLSTSHKNMTSEMRLVHAIRPAFMYSCYISPKPNILQRSKYGTISGVSRGRLRSSTGHNKFTPNTPTPAAGNVFALGV